MERDPTAPARDDTELDPDSAPDGAPDWAQVALPERYEALGEIGRGGSGVVLAARDRVTERHVALKVLRAGRAAGGERRDRFVREARIAAALEHPNVVPIYDIGELPDGQPYFTMRIVPHRSLAEVLDDPDSSRSLAWRCGVLLQVCRAVEYAHSRGVLHRDIKPANVLLGDHGEVYLADWGIAQVIEPGGDDAAGRAPGPAGTPGYMAPEQLTDDPAQGDARLDVYALGVTLFQVLTGRRPFHDAADGELDAIVAREAPRARSLAPGCPLVLDELCAAMLRRRPSERPASAEAVAAEIEAFLDGARERERRQQAAVDLAEQGRRAHAEAERLAVEQRDLEDAARRAREAVAPSDPIEHKRPVWDLERAARDLQIRRARALARASESYAQALGHDPACEAADGGLAWLHHERLLEAEATGDEAARAYHESVLREHDPARHGIHLDAPARVLVRTTPAGASVMVHRYVEVDRRLVPEPIGAPRPSPVELELPADRYQLVVELAGFRPVRMPLLAARAQERAIDLRLRTDAELGAGFVLVPAGPALVGGDPAAFDALPAQRVVLPDYAIGRTCVTFGEYLAFLDSLPIEEAQWRAPRDEGDGAYAAYVDGAWRLVEELIVEGEGRTHCAPSRLADVPVFGVSWFDALAYARHRAQAEGRPIRLPTELELEKAARGEDGRAFPWGDHFEATYAKTRESRPTATQPEPVGAFPVDESPYGVRDLAGGIRQWAADYHGRVDAREALARPERRERADPDDWRASRGGSWAHTSLSSRAASRWRNPPTARFPTLGIRLALDLPDAGT